MPNRLKLLRRQGPRIFDKIAKAKGPIAFLDESFLAPAQGPDSFYLLCAVVVDKSEIGHFRRALLELAGSRTWHSTDAVRGESGRKRLSELSRLIAESSRCVIAVLDEIPLDDAAGELARKSLIETLLAELAKSYLDQGGTVIYEKRTAGEMRSRDEQVLRQIKEGESAASALAVWGMATKDEPLLWAPDIVAWCYRQSYFNRDASFFQVLEKATAVIRV